MSKESHESLHAEAIDDLSKRYKQLRLVALVVIGSHLFQIEPSSLNAAGVTIKIEDVTVIRGGIALLFLFQLWSLTVTTLLLRLAMPLPNKRDFLLTFVGYARKPYRDVETKKLKHRNPTQVKRWARRAMIAFNLGAMPMGALMLALNITAAVLAIGDAWQFCAYLWAKV